MPGTSRELLVGSDERPPYGHPGLGPHLFLAAVGAEDLSARRRRLLVVEDDPSLRMVLRLVLEEAYDVVEAENGRAGLEILAASSFDAVLLDLMMPVMTGHEVLELMRARNLCTPVIVMTASVGDVGLEQPVREVLRKPFDIEDLEELLRDV